MALEPGQHESRENGAGVRLRPVQEPGRHRVNSGNEISGAQIHGAIVPRTQGPGVFVLWQRTEPEVLANWLREWRFPQVPGAETAVPPVALLAANIPANGTGITAAVHRRLSWIARPVVGVRLPLGSGLAWLASLGPAVAAGGALHLLADDLRYWVVAARFALSLISRQCFVPVLALGRDETPWTMWRVSLMEAGDNRMLRQLAEAMPPVARAITFRQNRRPRRRFILPDAVISLRSFLDTAADAFIRQHLGGEIPKQVRRSFAAKDAAREVLGSLLTDDRTAAAEECQPATPLLVEGWQSWVQTATGERNRADTEYRLLFQLSPPAAGSGAWNLRFFIQAEDDPNIQVALEDVWLSHGGSLRYLNRRFERPQEKCLTWLGVAAKVFPPLMPCLREARPSSCALAPADAAKFVTHGAALCRQCGFNVVMPEDLEASGKTTRRVGIRLRLGGSRRSNKNSAFGMASSVEYSWEIAIGGHNIEIEEFRRLAALKSPLVQIDGTWTLFDAGAIDAILRAWEAKSPDGSVSLGEAIGLVLSGSHTEMGGFDFTVVAEGWFAVLMDDLRSGDGITGIAQPEAFKGTLRPYQLRGVAWLRFLEKYGIGACLADDMGLGKTIEVIALLLVAKQEGFQGPTLLICPTSVMGNWEHEIKRFAPSLKAALHHGSSRASGADFRRFAEANDLVITSYGMARRDLNVLQSVKWHRLVVDEAQNIKNPAAKQSAAVRELPVPRRIALSGTPVENRLRELWSLMEFLNPGYLPKEREFNEMYAAPIERYANLEVSARLRAIVRPFILRRVKTDPNVIQDLPEKLEMKVYCSLTPEQALLYERAVEFALDRIEAAQGIQRKGIILATLTKLKQICNHPAHYLADGSALPARSGKLDRLQEMLETVKEMGEHALIFTQFVEMGHIIKKYLEGCFGEEALFMHGEVSREARDAMVRRFQESEKAPSFFVLSLKVGGLGLNLTRANHVFHFDRWWNPAVENQATDRAFRIGQQKNVQVRAFVTAGTVEERIDDLLEQKKNLAEQIIGSGENWLTELSTDKLRELFALDRRMVIES